MIDIFDQLGNTLNDIIGGHENNNVGWAWSQMQPQEVPAFADGGLVDTPDWLRGVQTAIKDTGSSMKNKTGWYDSPEYKAQHYTSMGKFFNTSDPTSHNKTSFNTTDNKKSLTSENPSDYFAKWYMGMRRFAEAAEVASRGQAGIRSK